MVKIFLSLGLRRPEVVGTYDPGLNTSIQKDFLILPYQYGTAIEYNGVVECWVGEWSIHRGLNYGDSEGKGNGWGGILWVGDDGDRGGVRATARNNSDIGGNVMYGELSVEKFGGGPNGDFRLRLPSAENEFQFVYGERGGTNIIAKITNQGLIIPKAISIATVTIPKRLKSHMIAVITSLKDIMVVNGKYYQAMNCLQVLLLFHQTVVIWCIL